MPSAFAEADIISMLGVGADGFGMAVLIPK
jgi:hypothetical protein